MVADVKNNFGRFIVVPDGDPYFNMASDEWLIRWLKASSNSFRAVIKLYRWKIPAITFGYNQLLEKAVDLNLLNEDIPVIRRITGGRAIYHDQSELTLTVIINLDYFPKEFGSVSVTNRVISEILVSAFGEAGMNSEWARQSDNRFKNPDAGQRHACFGSLSKFEITSGISKIAAGAQRKLENFLIHQGALKVNGVTLCPAINQRELPAEAGRAENYQIADFEEPIKRNFESELKINLKKSDFSKRELEEIENSIVFFLDESKKKRRIF